MLLEKRARCTLPILSAIFLVGILWIVTSFLGKLAFPESEYNFLGKTDQIKLDPESPLTQKFIASENNLSQIKVLIEKFDLLPGERIIFSLADSSCQNILSKETATFLTPKPHIYYRFAFPPVADSQGKEYCFRITYLSPYNRKGSERPIVEASSEEQFAGKSFFNEGKGKLYENRTLKIRPAYRSDSVAANLQELNNRISQYKTPLFKGASLTFLAAFFFLGTILFALWIASVKER